MKKRDLRLLILRLSLATDAPMFRCSQLFDINQILISAIHYSNLFLITLNNIYRAKKYKRFSEDIALYHHQLKYIDKIC